MIEQKLAISTNFEARPAALFVQIANKFKSNIYVVINNKTINAKSIMGMISLGVLDGQTITIVAEGSDEELAVNELKDFLLGI